MPLSPPGRLQFTPPIPLNLLLPTPALLSPRTPNEQNGEEDYFSRVITPRSRWPTPPPVEAAAPAAAAALAAPAALVQHPIRPSWLGRRIPFPRGAQWCLAGVAICCMCVGLTTLGLAITNRLERIKAGLQS
jgi:hypothetical protein